MSIRVLAVYALGAMLVSAPVDGWSTAGPAETTFAGRPLATVVAGRDAGFVLDREGQVVRVSGDGSARLVASIGRHSTPFGTALGGRVVFGGIRCAGTGCRDRSARLTILDGAGHLETSVELLRTSAGPAGLDGLALVGSHDGDLWVNGGGTLFQVAVASPGAVAVVAEVPWPGGEPCLIDGVLYDLVASAGSGDRQGAELPSTASFQLRLRSWNGDRWVPASSGATSMAYGQNAHCTRSGYEIRDGERPRARWDPGTGWEDVARADGRSASPRPDGLAPVTSSTRARYVVQADGSLLDITDPGGARWTGVTVPGVATSDMPPAVQVDDAGGRLFWCATTYQGETGVTRCAGAAGERRHASVEGWEPPSRPLPALGSRRGDGQAPMRSLRSRAADASDVHHYNLCSAACGGGVRPHTRDVVAWFVDRHRPVALSLNELCYDDGVHLSGRLPSGFGAGASYVAMGEVTNCPGAVKQFGNQVRVWSGSEVLGQGERGSGWWTQFPTQADAQCDYEVQECRGLACAEAGYGRSGKGTTFCSAHLESSRRGPTVADAQAGEYLDLVADRYRGHPARVLAGDFNLERPDADALLVTGGYRPTAVGPTVSGHDPSASREIDLVYFDGPTWAPGPAGSTYCDLQASDHCYVMASPNPLGLGLV